VSLSRKLLASFKLSCFLQIESRLITLLTSPSSPRGAFGREMLDKAAISARTCAASTSSTGHGWQQPASPWKHTKSYSSIPNSSFNFRWLDMASGDIKRRSFPASPSQIRYQIIRPISKMFIMNQLPQSRNSTIVCLTILAQLTEVLLAELTNLASQKYRSSQVCSRWGISFISFMSLGAVSPETLMMNSDARHKNQLKFRRRSMGYLY
jgi:hypothetical protein